MSRTWLYADPHFHHQGVCRFTREDGEPLRPWDDCEKMTEDMIGFYNEIVKDEDRVYILGDVAFSAANMHRVVPRLKGRKCLIPGNHEPPKMRKYFDLFDDVRGYVQRQGFILSHIPIHTGSMGRWKVNIHGHLHANHVKTSVPTGDLDLNGQLEMETMADPKYFCVSVEHTDYRPILLDEVLEKVGLK